MLVRVYLVLIVVLLCWICLLSMKAGFQPAGLSRLVDVSVFIEFIYIIIIMVSEEVEICDLYAPDYHVYVGLCRASQGT